MKLAQIVLSDFRGFPAGDPYVFTLDGKNLLLCGENGSGKSSLFHAVREMLRPPADPLEYATFRHVFTAGEEGVVTLELTEGSPKDYPWNYGEARPQITEGSRFWQIASRATFLDYKALLRTSFSHEREPHVNVWDLVITEVLRDAVPIGQTRSIGALWSDLLGFKPSHPPPREPDQTEKDYAEDWKDWLSDADQVSQEAAAFRETLVSLLETRDPAGRPVGILPRANRYLAEYLQPGLAIKLTPGPLEPTQVGPPHGFVARDLRLTATYFGHPVPHPPLFLNEARLTALALALYLAAAAETTRPAPGGEFPRLLVIDDALIGLDLAHRMPLLELLEAEFRDDWQVLLFTHDRQWWELAGGMVEPTGRWVLYELFAQPRRLGSGSTFDAPLQQPGATEKPAAGLKGHFLKRARECFDARDYRAAAMHTRAAFEVALKSWCSENSVAVSYKQDSRKVSLELLLKAVERRLKGLGKWAESGAVIERAKLFRRVVLNPLSHSTPSYVAPREIEQAMAAVADFELGNEYEPFKAALELLQTLPADLKERHCALQRVLALGRAGFEGAVRAFLISRKSRVPFRHDWSALSMDELWSEAKALIPVAAFAGRDPVAEVEARRLLLVEEFHPLAWASLQENEIRASLTAVLQLSNSGKPKAASWLQKVPAAAPHAASHIHNSMNYEI
jgi:energy-coupling factor transporter ATP-binding protein EcfA2